MSIKAMKQAIEAINEAVAFREGGRQKAIDAINALRTAIQQAESEPVAMWIDLRDGDIVQLGDRILSGGKTWRTVDLESELIGREYHAKQWWPMQRAYTNPAPGVPDESKRIVEVIDVLIKLGWIKASNPQIQSLKASVHEITAMLAASS